MQKSTLSEGVTQQILNAVKEGTWQPGEKIPGELTLAGMFNVSRNCMREALKGLALLKIIVAKPGQGTFVAKDAFAQVINRELTVHLSENVSVIELMEVRILLETQIVRWAIKRGRDEEFERLKSIIEQEQLFNRELTESSLKPRAKFHRVLAEIAGNSLTVKFLNSIRSEFDAQRSRYLDLPRETWGDMVNEHEKILEFIIARDAENACKEMTKHLKRMEVVIR
jgi:GntR family transcriptional repressor for pyruvate dehydrogenase complex